MKGNRHQSLKPFNTFGIDATCQLMFKIDNVQQLQEILKEESPPFFILGGGSNLLLSKDQDITFLKNEIKGKKVIFANDDYIHVTVGGGEDWHELVMWAIQYDYGGIENLSLIPGTVGASPIQNIGAYGVELEKVFVKLNAVNLESGKIETFDKDACQFGYRDSIFKRDFKGKYFITEVTFELTKRNHDINISYAPLQSRFETTPTIQQVSEAVIEIRQSKLPDPKVLGNSGSFFKNPIVKREVYEAIAKKHERVPNYDVAYEPELVKIPAGWLIDQAGWKGFRRGDAGVYEKQALVLVNHGKATGPELWQLALDIIADVKDKFGIALSPEVNVI